MADGPKSIERLIQQYERPLNGLMTAHQATLLSVWKAGWDQIQVELAALNARIDAAQQAGEQVSASWLLQERRLNSLQQAVGTQLNMVVSTVKLDVPEAVRDAYNLGALNADSLIRELQPAGIAADVYGLSETSVRNIAAITGPGSPFRDVVTRLGDFQKVYGPMRDALVTGVILGRNPADTARRLRQVNANLTLSRAQTIARTETLRAYRTAQWQRYRDSSAVEGWVWMAAGGPLTCAACYAMSGTYHPKTETLAAHVNCRCRMVPRTTGWEELGLTGLEDTRAEVPVGTEQFGRLPAEQQKAILGKGKYDLWKNGEIGLDDVVTIRSDPLYGKSIQVASKATALENRRLRRAGETGPMVLTYPPADAPPPPTLKKTPAKKQTSRRAKTSDIHTRQVETVEDLKALREDVAAAIRGLTGDSAYEAPPGRVPSKKGKQVEAGVVNLGRQIDREACRRAGVDYAEVQQIYDTYQKAAVAFRRKCESKGKWINDVLDPDYKVLSAAQQEMDRLLRVLGRGPGRPTLQQARLEVLSELREMGGVKMRTAQKPRKNSVAESVVEQVERFLPADWVRLANDPVPSRAAPYPAVRILSEQGRGYYSDGRNLLVAPKNVSVQIHEATHWVEHGFMRASGGASKSPMAILQDLFRKRRDSGPTASLQRIVPSHGYRSDEKTLEDNFSNPYVGKVYSDGFGEVMTMGVEHVFHTKHTDVDHAQFVLGMLGAL